MSQLELAREIEREWDDLVSETASWRKLGRVIRDNPIGLLGVGMIAIVVGVAVFAGGLAPHDPVSQIAQPLQPPGGGFPLGTDELGRDELSRVLYGARVSLFVGIISVGLAFGLGVLPGLVAGYFGGWVDTLVSRMMDVTFALPAIVLAIVIASVLGANLASTEIAIGIVYAPQFGRIARGPTMAISRRVFVDAARATGSSHLWIIIRHVLPNVSGPIIVQTTVALSTAILTEAALSYLGLGAQPPTPSWGTMLNAGKQTLLLDPWLSIFPGLAIAFTVLGFNLLGDALRDYLDPRSWNA